MFICQCSGVMNFHEQTLSKPGKSSNRFWVKTENAYLVVSVVDRHHFGLFLDVLKPINCFVFAGPSGKDDLRRMAVGIWHCKSLDIKMAGGAWVPETTTAATVKYGIKRLREQKET